MMKILVTRARPDLSGPPSHDSCRSNTMRCWPCLGPSRRPSAPPTHRMRASLIAHRSRSRSPWRICSSANPRVKGALWQVPIRRPQMSCERGTPPRREGLSEAGVSGEGRRKPADERETIAPLKSGISDDRIGRAPYTYGWARLAKPPITESRSPFAPAACAAATSLPTVTSRVHVHLMFSCRSRHLATPWRRDGAFTLAASTGRSITRILDGSAIIRRS
jgi:hypothetical protein